MNSVLKIFKFSLKFIFNRYFRNRVLGLIKNYTSTITISDVQKTNLNISNLSFYIIGACGFNHIINILNKYGAKTYLTHNHSRPWDPFAEVNLSGSLLWKGAYDYIILSNMQLAHQFIKKFNQMG